jgi:hypothetical protein
MTLVAYGPVLSHVSPPVLVLLFGLVLAGTFLRFEKVRIQEARLGVNRCDFTTP